MTDYHFPLIAYKKEESYLSWGQFHGECYRQAIKELVEIRKSLMLEKNPLLKNHLGPLSQLQWEVTKKYSPHLADELKGIQEGSGLSIEDIVILNNYTDFRDIELPEEGCSTIHIQKENNEAFSGQTWDMHRSAMKYLCLIHVPACSKMKTPDSLILSLLGCVGLMGMGANGSLIGVNNINTKNAKAALIWPVLVRNVLRGKNLSEMASILKKAPVTSGHNYLISTTEGGEHWEVTPEKAKCATRVGPDAGHAFHTNHCLDPEIVSLETPAAVNSTTHIRYELIHKKIDKVQSYNEFYQLLTDHENYPKSICAHFASGSQDPSFTCGGGIIHLKSKNKISAKIWRGCPHPSEEIYAPYREYNFLSNGETWMANETP